MTGTDRTLKILVVEDNPDDVFLLEQAFRKAGGKPVLNVVCDGFEAKAYLRGEQQYGDRNTYPLPDVMLLDLNMPRMNGFEVLEWLRNDAQFKGLMVHIVSASARESDIQRAYELHANSYIIKPSRVEELVQFGRALSDWHQFIALPKGQASLLHKKF